MKVLIIVGCFFLGFANCASNSTVLKDFRLLVNQPPKKQCATAGLMCSDCQHLVSCISNGEGGFLEIPSKTCSSGQTCLGGQCTENPNPACEALQHYKFVCKNSGMYPDPFDCHNYYFCLPKKEKPELAQCDIGFGYHAGTTFCQKKLDGDVCSPLLNEFPIPLCDYPGQTEALKDNPSLYYVCIAYNSNNKDVLYPFLYACPHGGTYDNYECIPNYL